MNKIAMSIISFAVFPLLSLAQIELTVTPTNSVVHVFEPVMIEVAVQNVSTTEVSGMFSLLSASFDIVRMENGETSRFYNAYMRYWSRYYIFYNPDIMNPGEKESASFCLLYNVWTDGYVFAEPGEYEIRLRLSWGLHTLPRPAASASARVTVLGWDKEKDKDQLAALDLWKDRDVADAFQDNVELSGSALDRLKKLKADYGHTVYGKWATIRLAESEPPWIREFETQSEHISEPADSLEQPSDSLEQPSDSPEQSRRLAAGYTALLLLAGAISVGLICYFRRRRVS